MITVLANGVFDLFHYGHLLHLEEAKRMGDRLVVSVTADECVNKPGRPIYPLWQRIAIVSSLKCVDETIVVPGLLEAIIFVKPDIVVKGQDYGALDPVHRKYCLDHNIGTRITESPKYSTTDIINEIRRRS